MSMVESKTVAAAGMAALAVLGMSACSSKSDTSSSSSSSAAAATSATADPAAANLVGTGCAGYASKVPSGPGSVAGMAQDPVAVAAGNNPLLTTLTATVSGKYNPGVNLVDTLDGGQFTVIAPTDDAFAKLPPATLNQLKTDAPLLNSILTYHVIPGRLSPSQVVGTHKSVQGGDVTVNGSGEGLKFDQSGLVCGGVQTANATVYMVDTVMMPPAAAPVPAGSGASGATAPNAGANTGSGGVTANVPGAGAGAGPGGVTANVPGAGAGAGQGGASANVPGASAGAGPGGARACAGGVCVGAGGG
jgi:uncharacterized surface protein with fasciclin (FAS1) repeats